MIRLACLLARPMHFAIAIMLLGVVLFGRIAAAETPLHITGEQELQAAVEAGVSGRVLELAPGTYGPILMRAEGVPSVLRSADPAQPAVLQGLLIENFEGLTIENVVLKYRFSPEDRIYDRPFLIRNCRNFILRDSRVEGDRARGLGFPHDGKGFAVGLAITNCRGVQINHTMFTGSWRALYIGASQDVTITGNEITGQRMDGMCFAQVENVRILDNHFHNFDRVDVPEDHADMIQFWTTHTTAPSRNIVIRNNLFNSGEGLYTQTIFMRNERVDSEGAGPEMFYGDILIADNVILNAHLHGITVGETHGLSILQNTLIQNKRSAAGNPHREVSLPRITLSPHSRDVRIEGNLTHGLRGYERQQDWQVVRNITIRDIEAGMRGLPYGRIFEDSWADNPADLTNWVIRPGGPGDRADIGAQVLRQR